VLKLFSLLLAASLALFIVSCGAGNTSDQQTGTAAKATISHVTMPVSTPITVTLVDSIDTDVQVSGSTFRATLLHDVVVDGRTLFADGAAAKGILHKVVQSGRLKTPAELEFSLTSIQSDEGRWVDIGTNMISEIKGSHTNREVAMIGGGAIAGGIIGKIINRDGSTEIGAAAGAAAGTGLAAATGKQDIFYGAGSEITFYSSQATQVALQ